MGYILQKLNVVKTASSEHARDALLAKGFTLIEEKKVPVKSTSKQVGKAEGDT